MENEFINKTRQELEVILARVSNNLASAQFNGTQMGNLEDAETKQKQFELDSIPVEFTKKRAENVESVAFFTDRKAKVIAALATLEA